MLNNIKYFIFLLLLYLIHNHFGITLKIFLSILLCIQILSIGITIRIFNLNIEKKQIVFQMLLEILGNMFNGRIQIQRVKDVLNILYF